MRDTLQEPVLQCVKRIFACKTVFAKSITEKAVKQLKRMDADFYKREINITENKDYLAAFDQLLPHQAGEETDESAHFLKIDLGVVSALIFSKYLIQTGSPSVKEQVRTIVSPKIEELFSLLPSNQISFSETLFDHLRLKPSYPLAVTVDAGASYKKFVNVDSPNSIVTLEFGVIDEGMDINFSAFMIGPNCKFGSEDQSYMVPDSDVILLDMVVSEVFPHRLTIKVKKPGLLLFKWSNEHSWFNAKQLKIHVAVLAPVKKKDSDNLAQIPAARIYKRIILSEKGSSIIIVQTPSGFELNGKLIETSNFFEGVQDAIKASQSVSKKYEVFVLTLSHNSDLLTSLSSLHLPAESNLYITNLVDLSLAAHLRTSPLSQKKTVLIIEETTLYSSMARKGVIEPNCGNIDKLFTSDKTNLDSAITTLSALEGAPIEALLINGSEFSESDLISLLPSEHPSELLKYL